jgi:steroid 5-alpha reductase family enzyme
VFSGCGAALAGAGLLFEWTADQQKWNFKADEANRGRFCNTGLWRLSQHPNYAGNLAFWTGILALNAPSLAKTPVRLGGAILSPLFMVSLFYGQASGAVTNSKQLFDDRYRETPGYEEYVASVPLVIPIDGVDTAILSRFKS